MRLNIEPVVGESVIVGQTAVPVSITVREPPISLVTVRVALLLPSDVGVKVARKVVISPGARLVVPGEPALNSVAFVPLVLNGGVSVIVLVSLFVTVTTMLELEPIAVLPKGMVVGETVMPGVAMPVSGTAREPLAALVTVSIALLVPVVVGTKLTVTIVEALGANTVPPGEPTLNSVASVPLMTNGGVSVTVAVLLLVIISERFFVVPTAALIKSRLVGEVMIAGVITLARFCGSLGEINWKSLALLFVSTWLPCAPPSLRS